MPPEAGSAGVLHFRRRLQRWTALVLAAVVLAGCSRLDFIRPDTSRRGFESTAHEVELRPDSRTRGVLPLVQLAQQRLAEGDLPGADREARKAVKFDSGSPQARTVLALVLDRSGRQREAGEQYRRAAELAPDRGGMLNNYGTWLCSNGRAAESLAWFDRALATPGYETPHAALANAGYCALQAGQTARAERDLRQAIAVQPTNALALESLARLHYDAGHLMEARAFSQRRLAAAPADPRVLLLASQIENKLGDRKSADGYVRRLRAEFPDARNSEAGDDGK